MNAKLVIFLFPILLSSIFISACDNHSLSRDQIAMIAQHKKMVRQEDMQQLADSSVYQGEYLNGLFQGKGKLIWRNGDSYEGEFQKGLMHGKGIQILPNLLDYKGDFVDGMWEGQGKLVFISGDSYVGAFKNGDLGGQGKFTSYDGTIHEGEFERGRANGEGKIIFTNDGVYEGGVKDWKMHGVGVYAINKAVYSGEFVEGIQEGNGEIIYSNGNRFKGEIKAWTPHGAGEYFYENGDYYKGDVDDGVLQGKGALTYKNNDTYVGEFKDDDRHGNGTFTEINISGEKSIKKGWWEYDEFIGKKPKSVTIKSAFARLMARIKNIGSKRKKINAETIFYSQPGLLETTLEKIKPSDPKKSDLYFIGFAAYGSQDVFMKETRYAKKLFDEQFSTIGRSTVLVNNHSIADKTPLASVTNLRLLLNDVGKKMDKDEDILFIYLTSHGSRKKGLDVSLRGVPLNDLPPKKLDKLLDDSGIKWKVVVVSACYSGGFIDALKDDYTLVMTASRKDRTSFGCSDEADFTYFGRALFKHAIPETDSFIAAFAKANKLVSDWEVKEEVEHSEPQIWASEKITRHLQQWRGTVLPSTSIARKANQ